MIGEIWKRLFGGASTQRHDDRAAAQQQAQLTSAPPTAPAESDAVASAGSAHAPKARPANEPSPQLQAQIDAQRMQLGMTMRKAGVMDLRVISAVIDHVKREQFLQPSLWHRAYLNEALPIGERQTISAPEIVAMMTDALKVEPDHLVLELGTGSGYQSAILSCLARHVYSIERWERLSKTAKVKLDRMGFDNISYHVGDGHLGWPQPVQFDRVLLTAAAASLPQTLFEQMRMGGLLVAPVGEDLGEQVLVRAKKCPAPSGSKREYLVETEVLGSVRFVPLVAGMPQG